MSIVSSFVQWERLKYTVGVAVGLAVRATRAGLAAARAARLSNGVRAVVVHTESGSRHSWGGGRVQGGL